MGVRPRTYRKATRKMKKTQEKMYTAMAVMENVMTGWVIARKRSHHSGKEGRKEGLEISIGLKS